MAAGIKVKGIRRWAKNFLGYLAVGAAEAALRDRLASREFSVEYSEEPAGAASAELTLGVYHLGLAAYYTYRLGLDAPEYAVMGCLLRRIYAAASRRGSRGSAP